MVTPVDRHTAEDLTPYYPGQPIIWPPSRDLGETYYPGEPVLHPGQPALTEHSVATPVTAASFGAPAPPAQTLGAYYAAPTRPRPGRGMPVAAPFPAAASTPDRYDLAREAYARAVAEQRSGYGPALLMREQGRRYQRLRRLGAIALDPLMARDYRDAERQAITAERARVEYLQALTDWIDARGHDPAQMVEDRLAEMATFENRVREHMLRQTVPNQFQDRLTRWWLEGSRGRRIVMVGLPAAVVGVGLGLGAVAIGVPFLTLAGGVVATVSGRMIGGGMARMVNRRQIGHGLVQADMENLAAAERAKYETYRPFAGQSGVPHYDIDITRAYTEATRQQAVLNMQRVDRAKRIGGTAAAMAYALTLAGAALRADLIASRPTVVVNHPTPTPTAHATPSPALQPTPTPTPNLPPTPGPAPVPHVTTFNTYPWNVAHQLDPNHPLTLIRHTIPKYNAVHHTHLKLAYHARTHKWVLEQHGRQVFGALRRSFNQYMASQYRPAA